MESFGTGDRIASSSRVASLVDCGFIDCSSFDRCVISERTSDYPGNTGATVGTNCSGNLYGTTLSA